MKTRSRITEINAVSLTCPDRNVYWEFCARISFYGIQILTKKSRAEEKSKRITFKNRSNEARNWTKFVRTSKKYCRNLLVWHYSSIWYWTGPLYFYFDGSEKMKRDWNGKGITYDWMETEWKICFDSKNSNYTVIHVKWMSSYWRHWFNPMRFKQTMNIDKKYIYCYIVYWETRKSFVKQRRQ